MRTEGMKVLSYKRRLTVTEESDGGGKFDISFNDLDKEYYPRCAGSGVEQSAPLRPVYNRERFVAGPGAEENDRDKDTRAIQEFQSAPVRDEGFLHLDRAIERWIGGSGESLTAANLGTNRFTGTGVLTGKSF
jgi:hypothetical protein